MAEKAMEKKPVGISLGTISPTDFAAIRESVLDGFLKDRGTDKHALTRDYIIELLEKNDNRNEPIKDEEVLIPLEDADFSNADLQGLDFSRFALKNVNFKGAKFDRKSLESLAQAAREGEVSLNGINLEGQDLSAKVVNRRDIGIVSLARVSLEGLDLRNANFKGANLANIDLDHTNLMGANFEGANLSRALMRNACLINADMMGVKLTEAKLNGSDLRGADLRRANINDADLTGIKL